MHSVYQSSNILLPICIRRQYVYIAYLAYGKVVSRYFARAKHLSQPQKETSYARDGRWIVCFRFFERLCAINPKLVSSTMMLL